MIRVLVAAVFYLALLGPGHPASTVKPDARWAAMPPAPHHSIEAGHESRAARVSFGSDAPVLRRAAVSLEWRRVAAWRPGRVRVHWLEYDPLYRRPPPSFS